VQQTSLRQVAAETKLAHGTVFNLHQCLGRVAPHPATIAKLRTWYFTQLAAGNVGAGLSNDEARYLIDQIFGSIPEPRRSQARHEFLFALERIFGGLRILPPEWVRDLQRDESGDGQG
jgi:hypothetical protein